MMLFSDFAEQSLVYLLWHVCDCQYFSLHGASAFSRLGPPDYRGFTITLRHTTLHRTTPICLSLYPLKYINLRLFFHVLLNDTVSVSHEILHQWHKRRRRKQSSYVLRRKVCIGIWLERIWRTARKYVNRAGFRIKFKNWDFRNRTQIGDYKSVRAKVTFVFWPYSTVALTWSPLLVSLHHWTINQFTLQWTTNLFPTSLTEPSP